MAHFSTALLIACALFSTAAFADDNDSLADAGATSVVAPAPETVATAAPVLGPILVETPAPGPHSATVVTTPAADGTIQAQVASPSYLRAKVRWNLWVNSRGRACDSQFDTISKFNPDSNRVALVLHGMGSNPYGMREVIDLLYSQGFTVLAPRLSGHFDKNIYDLDQVSSQDWINDSEQAFQLAKAFGKRITVVGYSLGGTLASRLMLEYPDQIENGILFAPAWRVTPTVSLGSLLGSLLHTSLNDYLHTPIACTVDGSYIPGNAGHEVENLIIDTEQTFGSTYSTEKPTTSVFTRARVPQIIFTSPKDDAIDRDAVSAMCAWSHYCKEITAGGTGHAGIPSHIDRSCRGVNDTSPVKKPTRGNPGETVAGDITRFIQLPQ